MIQSPFLKRKKDLNAAMLLAFWGKPIGRSGNRRLTLELLHYPTSRRQLQNQTNGVCKAKDRAKRNLKRRRISSKSVKRNQVKMAPKLRQALKSRKVFLISKKNRKRNGHRESPRFSLEKASLMRVSNRGNLDFKIKWKDKKWARSKVIRAKPLFLKRQTLAKTALSVQ